MGSKVKQTDPAQAAAANAGATGAATQAQNLATGYNAQQQQAHNLVFGEPGGSGGAITKMLDPNSLNVTGPTGPYALQFTKQKEQLAKGYQDAQAATTRGLAQSGFGANTPSGLATDAANKNARGLATDVGTAHAAATSNSYNDARDNFWKAANLAQSQAGTSQQGALQGTGTAAQTYGNLYGTAGQGHVVPGIGSSLLGAVGTLGSAAMGAATGGVGPLVAKGAQDAAQACVTVETTIRVTEHVSERAGRLRIGDRILGVEGPVAIIAEPTYHDQDCVLLETENGLELTCSKTHTLMRPGGGYVRAKDALGQDVLTLQSKDRISKLTEVGIQQVVMFQLNGSHTYVCSGIWCEE